jgi:Bacterial Ig-like domain (group 2)
VSNAGFAHLRPIAEVVMKTIVALLIWGMSAQVLAATYSVTAGSSAAEIQAIVNTAGASPGNTVAFAAGAYRLSATVSLPCSDGTIYTGPNVGTVTQSNLPTAVLSSTVATSYALSTDSNVTTLTGSQGCDSDTNHRPSTFYTTDGSTPAIYRPGGSTGTLPDAQGNSVTSWNTTNHRVAMVSSRGHVTAMAAGAANVQAVAGSVPVSPWTVAVFAATSPDKQAASAANASPSDTAGAAALNEALNQAPPAAAMEAAPVAIAIGPGPSAAAAPLTDKFLGPFWRLVAPAGGSASISNSHLFLAVPGGSNHDALAPGNQAVRVVQTIGNEDFDVAIKIDFPMVATEGGTSQGLMVLSDDEDFVTFALVTDGSSIGLRARTVTHGAAIDVLNDMGFSQYQNPMYLRLTRSKSNYVAFYSIDGVGWNEASSFSYTRASTAVGPFATNYSDAPANAFPVLMSVSWFGVRQQ